jgi:hypothetical protein
MEAANWSGAGLQHACCNAGCDAPTPNPLCLPPPSLPLPLAALQAVTFLVIGNKPKKTLDDITRDLCPVLSIQQLYRISTMYWDDKYNTETVSSDVSSLRPPAHSFRHSHVASSVLLAHMLGKMHARCMHTIVTKHYAT